MKAEMLEPLDFYEHTGKQRHLQNAKKHFDELVKQSGIDAEQNKQTVAAYNKQMTAVKELQKKISKFKSARTLLIFLSIIGAVLTIIGIGSDIGVVAKILLIVLGIGSIIASIIIIVKKLNKLLRGFSDVLAEEQQKANTLLAEAKKQMQPLLALFDDYDTLRLIEETVPDIAFEKQWTPRMLANFTQNYAYADLIGKNASVIDTLAGNACGNPFLFERYIEQTMGQKTYHGSLRIEWVTYEKDSKGNVVTKHHSQTLHASVIKPLPLYTQHTHLCFGHQSTPELSFSRKPDHIEKLSEKALEHKVSAGEKHIQQQARKALKQGKEFTEMANSKFDVLFGALDRNNEQQFRMMFTPLAQTGMVKLMRSHTGYGDDFAFMKRGKFNLISSDHAQSWQMSTSPSNYFSHDLEECRNKFYNFNSAYFKSVFFDLAPLLTIPLYQEEPDKLLDTSENSHGKYTAKEYETLANRIGRKKFAHSNTATDVILKTALLHSNNSVDTVAVTAHSFAGVPRVDYISVRGGDDRYHNVPVPWVEYIPIEKTTKMSLDGINLSNYTYSQKLIPKGTQGKLACYHNLLAYAHLSEDDTTDIHGIKSNLLSQ